MHARMSNPTLVIPEAMQGINTLISAVQTGGVSWKTLHLVHLRVSQINGCSYCVDGGARDAKKRGETDQRLFAVAAWRHAPYFTEAERAALALAEAVTRMADQPDPVPDEIWDEAARHYEERALGALLLWISTVNVFNRVNVATRLPAGTPMPWN